MKPSPIVLAGVFALAAPLRSQPVQTQETPRPAITQYNLEKGGLALSGYDPVAYFAEGGGKPAKGKKEISSTHRGVTYRFASTAHRDLFLADPERYEPAYGGWCAWAMTDGDQVEVDPESFLIEKGRLLVFYDGFLADTRKKWLKKGGDELMPRADAAWTKISGELPPRDVSGFDLQDGLALSGYDPVSYRTGAPAPGKPEITTRYRGVTYRFASEEARKTFLEDPARHEPRYGGWCATAMSRGERVAVDPTVFVLDEDGLLFLFHDAAARNAWKEGGPAMRANADREWAALVGGK